MVIELCKQLPTDSWLRKYIAYSTKLSTTPMGYHVVTGLALLSATIPDNGTVLGFGSSAPCTFFGLLVGRSGEDQKSTALKIGRKLVYEVDPNIIGDNPASYEGCIESLSEKNKQLIFYSEMGNFLASTKTGYGEAIKTCFTGLWDGDEQTRAKSGQVIRCDKPRLNLLGACATKYLEQYTTDADWNGGFLGRFFIIHAQRERIDPLPCKREPKGRDWLIGTLQNKIKNGIGRCVGYDDEFEELYKEWHHKEFEKLELPKIITGQKVRLTGHLFRLCTLMMWDTNTHATKGNYLLTANSLKHSLPILNLYLESLKSLAGTLSFDKETRLRNTLLGLIRTRGSMSYSQLLKATKATQKSINEGLNWLIASQDIKKDNFANMTIYSIKEENKEK